MFQRLSKSILSNSNASVPGEMASKLKQFGKDQGTASRVLQGDVSRQADKIDGMFQSFSDGDSWGGIKKAGGLQFDHITGKDMAGEGWARAGAVAARNGIPLAAYGAAANIPRYISGGTATTNNQGQRDIAGIPFL